VEEEKAPAAVPEGEPEPEKPQESAPPRERVTRDRDGSAKKGTGEKVAAGANAVRSRIASIVWLLAVLCALLLAVGALLVALDANKDNAIVKFVLDVADALDLDVFGRRSGIFTFDGKDAATKGALVNWGIGAIAYLVVGKVADRIIRP
jgi:hypothetical protein